MRVLILAALLLGSSSLNPLFAQEQKPAVEAPQTTAPGRTDQNAEPPRESRIGRDQSRAEDRTVGPDWRMRRRDDGRDRGEMRSEGSVRGDSGRFGRGDREMGAEGRIRGEDDFAGRGDREMAPEPRMRRERDGDRGGMYAGREDRGQADRYSEDRGTFDDDRPRRRVKICIEYDNGDEYCRYRR